MPTISCVNLYSLRNMTEFCSGSDLSQFFASRPELDYEPSPAAQDRVDRDAAVEFVFGCADAMAHNAPSTARFAYRAKEIAKLW